MILVYGATSSGKSNIAENIAVKLNTTQNRTANMCDGPNSLIYLATMESESDAARERIEHHRKLRSGKGFTTIEEALDLSHMYNQAKKNTVLLECMSNLVANVLFDRFGETCPKDSEIVSLSEEIADQVIGLDELCELVVVTNDVFGEYYHADAWCDSYMKLLGMVNIHLADKAECFIEVRAGVPTFLKGEKRW